MKTFNELVQAIKENDLKEIKLAKTYLLDIFDNTKEMLLNIAIENNNLEIFEFLFMLYSRDTFEPDIMQKNLKLLGKSISHGEVEITEYILSYIDFFHEDASFGSASIDEFFLEAVHNIRKQQEKIMTDQAEFEDLATDSPENTEQIKTSLSEINSSGDFKQLDYCPIDRALELSVLNGFYNVTRYLIDKVTDISYFKELLIDSCEYINHLLEERNE